MKISSLFPVLLSAGFGFFLVSSGIAAEKKAPAPDTVLYQTSFSAGTWNKEDFLNVKCARLRSRNDFFQEKEYITNQVPEEIRKTHPKSFTNDYASLLLNKKIVGGSRITARMSFEKRMAPLLVLAAEPEPGTDGLPEYREHLEIVLFDRGINVWHHSYRNGQQTWYKAAFLNKAYEPMTVCELEVAVTFDAKGECLLVISCDGTELFGCATTVLKKDQPYYAGITGCEGPCRFYDFKVIQPSGK